MKSVSPAVMAITVLAAVMSQGATVLMESFTDAHAGILAASGASWENLSETAGETRFGSYEPGLTVGEAQHSDSPLHHLPAKAGQFTTTSEVTFTALPTTNASYFAHLKVAGMNFSARPLAATTAASGGLHRLGISNDDSATVVVATDVSVNLVYPDNYGWDFTTNPPMLPYMGTQLSQLLLLLLQ